MTDLIHRLFDGPLKGKEPRKPTIEELEKILSEEWDQPVRILPSGEVRVVEMDWHLFGVIIEHVRTLPEEQQWQFSRLLARKLGVVEMPYLGRLNLHKQTPEMAGEALLEVWGE